MAQLKLVNAVILYGGANLSGDSNVVNVNLGAQMLNDTVFGDTAESNKAGLLTAQFGCQGFWNVGSNPDKVDTRLFADQGSDDKVLAIFPDGATEGSVTDRGYATLVTQARYSPFNGARHGALLPYMVDFRTRGRRVVQASPLKTALNPASPITASWTGTAYQIGAITGEDLVIPTPQRYLYAGIHVVRAFADSGFSLAVTIQSDDNAGFSSPTARVTFATKTDVGAEYATRVAGPITDSWWRCNGTLAGVDASALVLVWMGIAE